MTRGRPMTGTCRGCGVGELQARQLCLRCYDYARTQALRQGLDLDAYLAGTTDLASPGRHHDRPHKHNRSGHRGCSFDRGKWRASIRFQGKAIYLGRFEKLELARDAYKTAQMRVRAGLPSLAPMSKAPATSGNG